MVTTIKAVYSTLLGLALCRFVGVRSCFFTGDTSCDIKMWKGAAPKWPPPLGCSYAPKQNNTTPQDGVVCLLRHILQRIQYTTLRFAPKSQNRANVVANLRLLYLRTANILIFPPDIALFSYLTGILRIFCPYTAISTFYCEQLSRCMVTCNEMDVCHCI